MICSQPVRAFEVTELPPAEELASVFARMSGLLLSRESVGSALDSICALAAETVPGSVGAGLTLTDDDGRRTTAGATDPLVGIADVLQYELDEGPCLSAARERVLMRIDDTTTETRWPRWCRRAAELGLRATLSAPLLARGESIGAIKVYAREPGAYDARAERLLDMFAGQAALLLANVQSAHNVRRLSGTLRGALASRDAIAMAKGLTMARDHVDEATAFARLVQIARRDGCTAAQVAERLTQSRPAPPP